MACILIYVRMVLTVALALGIDAAVLWFYFRRVRPFMREVERKYLTGMTTRDTSSSSNSSSVPSARTVTRYSMPCPNGVVSDSADMVKMVLASDVDPLLAALADKETEIATLKKTSEPEVMVPDGCELKSCDDCPMGFVVKQGSTLTRCSQCHHIHKLNERITALTARAEAAEADLLEAVQRGDDWRKTAIEFENKLHAAEAGRDSRTAYHVFKLTHEKLEAAEARIVELNVIVQAAEATLATLREEFQRHKDQSFKLFTDAVDRADQSEATVAHLREAANVALSFLRHMTDDAKGLAGATAERTLLSATLATLPPSAPSQE